MIRLARYDDLDRIMEIYQEARNYMEANGNPDQWGKNHPPRQLLEEDIGMGRLYVYTENRRAQTEDSIKKPEIIHGEIIHGEIIRGETIHGVFAFIIGADPTYTYIEEGAWLNDEIYGTIHRIAGDGVAKGVFEKCLDFCKSRIDNLRIDTHHKNYIMQHLVEKNGFERCGIVYMEDGSPRIAYQYLAG